MKFEANLEASVAYLNSPAATKALAADAYWPKWNSPWWHLMLLFEMGEAKRIPEKAIREVIAATQRYPLKIFPIRASDMPEGTNPFVDVPCHCQLGSIYQVLYARGINVDEELPWIRPWLLRYQMADGGLTCDSDAYLVKDECPSSMVGTVAAFEAILLCTDRSFTNEEKLFLERAGQFLLERNLTRGSTSHYNAVEREEAAGWRAPFFPRFYFYDVLRGLSALLQWREKMDSTIDAAKIREAFGLIDVAFPGGKILNHGGPVIATRTLWQEADGKWSWGHAATSFPLLQEVSRPGIESPFLSRQWAEVRKMISRDPNLSELLSPLKN